VIWPVSPFFRVLQGLFDKILIFFETAITLLLSVVETNLKNWVTLLTVLYNFANDLRGHRSKVKVTFGDPGTLKLKFENQPTLFFRVLLD